MLERSPQQLNGGVITILHLLGEHGNKDLAEHNASVSPFINRLRKKNNLAIVADFMEDSAFLCSLFHCRPVLPLCVFLFYLFFTGQKQLVWEWIHRLWAITRIW